MLPRILWHYLLAKRNYRLPLKELKQLQDQKLRRLMHYVYTNVRFYHDRFRSLGIKPGDVKCAEDLGRFPTLTRFDIHANFPEGIVVNNNNRENAIVKNTTGTTGQRLKIFHDTKSFDVYSALMLRRTYMTGLHPWDRVVKLTYFGQEEDVAENKNVKKALFLNRLQTLLFGALDTEWLGLRVSTLGIRNDNLKEISNTLYRIKPTAIYGRPSYMKRLAYLLEDEDLKQCVKKLYVTGEFLSKGSTKDLETLYQADVFNTYGAAEFWFLGCECLVHSGIHLNSDYYVFEFLKDGEPASPGEEGEVVITSLVNETMPLIRYRLGDIVIPEEEDRCNCGSYLPRLREIQGRLNDGLISSNGVRLPPGPVINHIESIIGCRDHQLIQYDYGKILVRYDPRTIKSGTLENLAMYLKGILEADLNIEFETWNHIPVKYRPIVNKVDKDKDV